jgi:hypothetical protein
MHEHGSPPRARQDGLLEETVGEELLLYDESSHIAHCLSPIAAGVWRHCDGERDVSELAVLIGASENLVADALRELREKDLLAAEPTLMQSTVPGISRRDVIVRGVRVGAAVAAVPLIVSATAATPAMASSGEGACKNTGLGTDSCCLCLSGVCHKGVTTNKECIEICKKEGGLGAFEPEKFACA